MSMTDRELVREICKKLNLLHTENTDVKEQEYHEDEDGFVLGSGGGYSFFKVGFGIDKEDKLTGHSVYE